MGSIPDDTPASMEVVPVGAWDVTVRFLIPCSLTRPIVGPAGSSSRSSAVAPGTPERPRHPGAGPRRRAARADALQGGALDELVQVIYPLDRLGEPYLMPERIRASASPIVPTPTLRATA